MAEQRQQGTQLWIVPEFDNLELFRANAIHYSYARHSHAGYAIGIIEAGVGGNYYQGATYLAPPQSIVLINPEEAHTGYSAEELPLTYRMIYASVELIQRIADEVGIRGLPYFGAAVVEDEMLVEMIVALCIALERSPSQLERQSLLVESFSTLLLRYNDVKSRSIRSTQNHPAIDLIKDYLHDNFNSTIALEQLVAITNLNRSYLIRLFRQATGMPPYTYLNQIRVNQAKQLLRQGMGVAEVAIAVGLADQSHLTRHFKRIVGVTPGHYRQMSTSFKTN
ncbi:MAG: AraC family transcriptional regulator [Leptolyngbyaceae cyanobacterium SL_7_1]|nr:AraC family transcriptional regulator [Leptolyngbyaceae cyanobacterium SL_7_1]